MSGETRLVTLSDRPFVALNCVDRSGTGTAPLSMRSTNRTTLALPAALGFALAARGAVDKRRGLTDWPLRRSR
jgi:hypothetical protein